MRGRLADHMGETVEGIADLYLRLMAVALAASLSLALAVPALAQSDEGPAGLEVARRAAAAAIELATGASGSATGGSQSPAIPPSEPPDQSDEGAGTTKPGKGNSGKGDPGKGNSGKTDPGKTDPGKSDSGKGDPGKTDPGQGNSGKGDPGKTDLGKTTGLERAAAAIGRALGAGNGAGNSLRRGHAGEVIESLLNGALPSTLTADESHGAKVSAMVNAYNELSRADSR